MTDEPLLRKLQVKNGRSLRLIDAPAEYVERITPLPEGCSLVPAGEADVVQVFVRTMAEVEAQAQDLSAAVGSAGVLWISYPKSTSKNGTDIAPDIGWDPMSSLGWKAVAQISIDEVWSAVRFRLEDDLTPRAR